MADFLDVLHWNRCCRRGAQYDHRSQWKDAAHGCNASVLSEAALCGCALSELSVFRYRLADRKRPDKSDSGVGIHSQHQNICFLKSIIAADLINSTTLHRLLQRKRTSVHSVNVAVCIFFDCLGHRAADNSQSCHYNIHH